MRRKVSIDPDDAFELTSACDDAIYVAQFYINFAPSPDVSTYYKDRIIQWSRIKDELNVAISKSKR